MGKHLHDNATLIGRQDVAPGLARFHIRPDAPLQEEFLAGQYVTIGINRPEGHADPESVLRPMSIASPPEDDQSLELYVRRISQPESELPLSHLLFGLPLGGRMYLRPVATGRFTIEDTIGESDPRTRLMVGAGTGIAPFMSMVRSRARRSRRLDDVVLLHGVSGPADLGFREELETMVDRLGLRSFATISRPDRFRDWAGPTGRVEGWLAADRIETLEKRLGVSIVPERTVVYVCGLQATISGAVRHLLARGYIPDHRKLRTALGVADTRPSNLFFEQYDTDALFDVANLQLISALRAELERGIQKAG